MLKIGPDTQKVRGVVRTHRLPATAYQQQVPLEFSDLSKLNMNAFENYCLILSAIEDNLAEFKQLKETLEQVKNSEQKRKTYCFF